MSPPTRLGQTGSWVGMLLVAAAFALTVAPSANADEIYSFTSQSANCSFQVPTRITTNTTGITNFFTFSKAAAGFIGCSGAVSADLIESGGTFRVATNLALCQTNDARPGEGTTVRGGGNVSLTITTEESGVPEPSTLLLLGGGLAALIGLRRKRSGSREYLAYQGHDKRAIRLD